MSALTKPKAFPAVTGGCYCQRTRYRLLTAPLFCYACHCADCQRRTGSAFTCSATIEADRVVPEPNSLPFKISSYNSPAGAPRDQATCSECETNLWGADDRSPAIVNVRIGTLDIPSLMEPDIHCFVKSKLAWVGIPDGARRVTGWFEPEDVWPKESLRRFKVAEEKLNLNGQGSVGAAGVGHGSERGDTASIDDEDDEHELDKTPTAQSPSAEEDLEFERKLDETEKELMARLEKLTLKLAEQEKKATTQAI